MSHNRIIHSRMTPDKKSIVKVYFDSDLQEYQVKIIACERGSGAYRSNDRTDAINASEILFKWVSQQHDKYR